MEQVLDWEQEQGWSHALTDNAEYSIQTVMENKLTIRMEKPFLFLRSCFHIWLADDESDVRIEIDYDSFEAAKAACERHYATGKWD